MPENQLRVLRLIEYVGTREWIEKTLDNSIQNILTLPQGTIRTATLGTFPEVWNEFNEAENRKE